MKRLNQIKCSNVLLDMQKFRSYKISNCNQSYRKPCLFAIQKLRGKYSEVYMWFQLQDHCHSLELIFTCSHVGVTLEHIYRGMKNSARIIIYNGKSHHSNSNLQVIARSLKYECHKRIYEDNNQYQYQYQKGSEAVNLLCQIKMSQVKEEVHQLSCMHVKIS